MIGLNSVDRVSGRHKLTPTPSDWVTDSQVHNHDYAGNSSTLLFAVLDLSQYTAECHLRWLCVCYKVTYVNVSVKCFKR